MSSRLTLAYIFLASILSGCAVATEATDPNDLTGGELDIGDVSEADLRADGTDLTYATQCKPIPDLPALSQPEIHLSIDGLTLRLIDKETGFEKVFPVGVGEIDTNPESITYGESLSMYPLLANGTQTFTITRSSRIPCAVLHQKTNLPLFAGLPFLSWSGPYGIHGPIDNYAAPNGGNLRRGFVSHGCVRMEAADVLEVYARIRKADNVPVIVQREPERRADGRRIDLEKRWIGAECEVDADCNFNGGVCRPNAVSGRNFCTVECTTACPDRAGQPATFCVRDEDDTSRGLCMPQAVAQNSDCRTFDHFVPKLVTRPSPSTRTARTCVPGTRGGIGDRCIVNDDCDSSLCTEGVCTTPCSGLCGDLPGYPATTCIRDFAGSQTAQCARTCTPKSNASECPGGTECIERARATNGSRFVCEPVMSTLE